MKEIFHTREGWFLWLMNPGGWVYRSGPYRWKWQARLHGWLARRSSQPGKRGL